MEWKTFKEWSARGMQIMKGAKSESRNENGEPLFSSLQVIAPRWSSARSPRRRNFYDGGLRGEQAHYSASDCDLESDMDNPEYDEAYNAAWGLD